MEVTGATPHENGFKVTLAGGGECFSRKLLLATGVQDHVPKLEGMEAFYGRSVHHCPYCDGWDWRDQSLAVYGRKQHGYSLALALKNWSRDVVLLSDGPADLDRKQRAELERLQIPVYTAKIARLEGKDGLLERIVFTSAGALERKAMFFSTGQSQCCDLPKDLGCVFTRKGAVETGRMQETNVPGVYVCGDAARDVQFVIVAAAEGAKAAEAINEALMEEDRRAYLGETPN